MRVCVVGAGVSGLTCASRLLELLAPQLQVAVYEWGRGPGGRTARRRTTIGEDEVSFDHAAPYFTARTAAFRDGPLSRWTAAGLASRWGDDDSMYVGTPSSNAIARGIASRLEAAGGAMRFGEHVLSADYSDGEWIVRSESRASGEIEERRYDALVLSDKLLIQENTYAVLAPPVRGDLALPSPLSSRGAIVLMAAFERGSTPHTTVTDVLTLKSHRCIEQIVHDSAKPGRGGEYDLWVVHSTPEYATAHLDGETLDDNAAVLQQLKDEFIAVLAGPGGDPTALPPLAHASVMAWDHSQPIEADRLDSPHLLDQSRRAGACGDYFGRGMADGVEAAALSGLSLAEALAPLLHADCARKAEDAGSQIL